MPEIHGHRGFRGRVPENTIPGFIAAIAAGATAIELDVVVTACNKLVVSHEPWMLATICTSPDGTPIPEEEQKHHNLYQMPYAQIRQYDCGLLRHPDFPEQQTATAYKPLFLEAVQAVEQYISSHGRQQVLYNVEVKSSPEEEGDFYPSPDEYTDLLINELSLTGLPDSRWLVQSFDMRILQGLHRKHSGLTLGILIEDAADAAKDISCLGFKPHYYNPDFKLVNADLITYCKRNQINILPWTVNKEQDMQRLLRMGVNGIITDFPDLAAAVVKSINETG